MAVFPTKFNVTVIDWVEAEGDYNMAITGVSQTTSSAAA